MTPRKKDDFLKMTWEWRTVCERVQHSKKCSLHDALNTKESCVVAAWSIVHFYSKRHQTADENHIFLRFNSEKYVPRLIMTSAVDLVLKTAK